MSAHMYITVNANIFQVWWKELVEDGLTRTTHITSKWMVTSSCASTRSWGLTVPASSTPSVLLTTGPSRISWTHLVFQIHKKKTCRNIWYILRVWDLCLRPHNKGTTKERKEHQILQDRIGDRVLSVEDIEGSDHTKQPHGRRHRIFKGDQYSSSPLLSAPLINLW